MSGTVLSDNEKLARLRLIRRLQREPLPPPEDALLWARREPLRVLGYAINGAADDSIAVADGRHRNTGPSQPAASTCRRRT